MNVLHFATPDHKKAAFRLLAVCFVWLTAIGMAQAQRPPDTSEGEIAMLPKYCVDTMGFGYGDAYTNTSPKAGVWLTVNLSVNCSATAVLTSFHSMSFSFTCFNW